jgi:hypothetical protein
VDAAEIIARVLVGAAFDFECSIEVGHRRSEISTPGQHNAPRVKPLLPHKQPMSVARRDAAIHQCQLAELSAENIERVARCYDPDRAADIGNAAACQYVGSDG